MRVLMAALRSVRAPLAMIVVSSRGPGLVRFHDLLHQNGD